LFEGAELMNQLGIPEDVFRNAMEEIRHEGVPYIDNRGDLVRLTTAGENRRGDVEATNPYSGESLDHLTGSS
jgi:hypothetical protein